MKIFGQIVRTAVNLALMPVAITKDIVTLGGIVTGAARTATSEALDRLKDEASE